MCEKRTLKRIFFLKKELKTAEKIRNLAFKLWFQPHGKNRTLKRIFFFEKRVKNC